ncbi:helix-turn-helix domain-containing protein [Prochlorothrix hollandica]|uniref:helix-turn-helix domain-containing protein n=1 Tax=Prochlorothrix hollandica TaxID=1223 RepID=UPI00034815C0|nr:helix-turn-helix transcriptional regulator [Prochlorothrix hollandica]
MGKAGRVLREVLQDHGISQNRLAIALGMRPSVVYRWVSERTDPTGDTIVTITVALRSLNPPAARAFIQLYLGDLVEGD